MQGATLALSNIRAALVKRAANGAAHVDTCPLCEREIRRDLKRWLAYAAYWGEANAKRVGSYPAVGYTPGA